MQIIIIKEAMLIITLISLLCAMPLLLRCVYLTDRFQYGIEFVELVCQMLLDAHMVTMAIIVAATVCHKQCVPGN